MRVPNWLRPLTTCLIPTRRRRALCRASLRPGIEQLEDRTTPTAGALDTSFGSGGLLTGDPGGSTIVIEQVIGSDHKLLVANQFPTASPNGSSAIARLTRYDIDGHSLDTSFGQNGVVDAPVFFGISEMFTLSNGKIVAVGTGFATTSGDNENHSVGVISLFLPDGQLDASFGSAGTIVTDFRGGYNSVTELDDGSFLVGGSLNRLLATGAIDHHAGNTDNYRVGLLEHFSADGSLDTTFGNTADYPGIAQIDLGRYGQQIYDLAIKSNGSIVAAVNGAGRLRPDADPPNDFDAYIAQFTSNGALDSNFNGQGWARIVDPTGALTAASLIVQPSGAIVVGGGRFPGAPNCYVSRLTATGVTDTTFGNNGTLTLQADAGQLDILSRIVAQPDGKLLLVGRTTDRIHNDVQNLEVMRLTADGQLDTGFGTSGNGVVMTRLESLNPSLPSAGQDYGWGGIIDGSGRLVVAATTIDPTTLATHFGLLRYELGKVNQTITFDPLSDKTYGESPFTISATASSGLPVSFSIVSGPATISGNTITLTGAGTVTIRASQPGNATYNPAVDVDRFFVVGKAHPIVTVLGGSFVYDGQPHPATGMITGVGGEDLGTPAFTYDGANSIPADAGTYAVVGSYAGDANYASSSATDTLVIGKATATVDLGSLVRTYNGLPQVVTPTANAPGTSTFAVTYDGSPTAPTNAGTYQVVAVLDNSNYQGSVMGTLVIGIAHPRVTVTGGSYVFDGQSHPATGSVTGVGGVNLGTPTFTYSYQDGDGNWVPTGNDGTDLPIEPGYYRALGSFAGNANYDPGSATACVTIAYDARSLTDLSKAFHAGRTIPIKLQLTDANGNNLSSSDIDLSAIRLERVNVDGTRTEVALQDAGNSNPDNLFRYDSSIGGYIFNLSTKNLGAGTYDFFWMAEGDPTEHSLRFWLI